MVVPERGEDLANPPVGVVAFSIDYLDDKVWFLVHPFLQMHSQYFSPCSFSAQPQHYRTVSSLYTLSNQWGYVKPSITVLRHFYLMKRYLKRKLRVDVNHGWYYL